jgi:hypothetical protein
MSAHVLDRLSAFLDDELPEAERREVEAHLTECSDCASRLSELAAIDEGARGLAVVAPSGYFEALPGRIRRRLPIPRRRAVPVWAWAVAAAALLAVVTPKLLREPIGSASLPAAPPVGGGAPEGASAATPQAAPKTVAEEAAKPKAADKAQGAGLPAVPEAVGLPEAVGSPGDSKAAGATSRPATPAREAAPAQSEIRRRDQPAEGGALSADTVTRPATAPAPQALGYTAAPPAPPAAAAAPGSNVADGLAVTGAREPEAKLDRRDDAAEQESAPVAANRGLAKGRMKDAQSKSEEDAGAAAPQKKQAFGGTTGSATDARERRERWRATAGRHPEGAPGDAARLAIVEAGAEAFALGHDSRDLELLRRDAQAYLAHADALQPDHVRELLRAAEER